MTKNAIIFLLGGVIGAILAIGIPRTWKTQESGITSRTSDAAVIVQSRSLGAPRPDAAPYPSVMSWPEISGLDLKWLAPKLREMGCPENLIRDILVAEANRKLAQQLKSLCAKIPNLYSNFLSADGQVQVVFDHLNKARFTCLSEIFGNDIRIDDDQIGKPYREVRPEAGLLSDEQGESIERPESGLSKKNEGNSPKSPGFLSASD